MAKIVITDGVVTLDGTDISASVTSVECPASAEELATTNFGSAGYKDSVLGEKSASVTLNLVLDSDLSSGAWSILQSNFGSAVTFTAKLDDASTSASNPAFTASVNCGSVPFGGSVNQTFTPSVTLQCTGSYSWATS